MEFTQRAAKRNRVQDREREKERERMRERVGIFVNKKEAILWGEYR